MTSSRPDLRLSVAARALALGFGITLAVTAQGAYAQTGSALSTTREPDVTDLIVRPSHIPPPVSPNLSPPNFTPHSVSTSTASTPGPSTQSAQLLATAPPMPPFTRPMLAPSEQLIERAKALLGIPYKYAGTSPESGFDCSGLVRYVFRDVLGISLPARADEIVKGGEKLGEGNLSPGDLVFFNTLNRPFSHVGIYLGNRQFLHSPASGGVVRIESMTLPYWSKRYQGARRMVSQESQVGTVAGITPELVHGAEILIGNSNLPLLGEPTPGSQEAGTYSPSNGSNGSNTGVSNTGVTNTNVGNGTSGPQLGNTPASANKRGKVGETAKAVEPARPAESKAQDSAKNPDQLDLFLKKLKERP